MISIDRDDWRRFAESALAWIERQSAAGAEEIFVHVCVVPTEDGMPFGVGLGAAIDDAPIDSLADGPTFASALESALTQYAEQAAEQAARDPRAKLNGNGHG